MFSGLQRLRSEIETSVPRLRNYYFRFAQNVENEHNDDEIIFTDKK